MTTPNKLSSAVEKAVGIVPTPMLDPATGSRMGGNMDIGPVLVDRICAAVAPLLAEQDAEIERLRKDCERLDWLESNLRLLSRATSPDMGGRNWTLGRVDGRVPKDYIHERSVRAAIDAAIAAKGAI